MRELKKEDFILITALNGVKVLALRPDYFDQFINKEDLVKEAFEKKIAVEIVEVPSPSKEELAEIAKQKKIEEKKAKLREQLAELEGTVEAIKGD